MGWRPINTQFRSPDNDILVIGIVLRACISDAACTSNTHTRVENNK